VIVLAIETATIEVGAAIGGPSGVLAAVTARPGRRHAETLHPAIAEACRLARVSLAEVGALAVDVGPGLFTGLRVGVAAGKALALALGVPVVGLSSLEILAHSASTLSASVVVPVVDVRRGEVAWAMPAAAGGTADGGVGAIGAIGAIGSPRLGSLAELAADLVALSGPAGFGAPDPGGEVLLVGDGARRYASELSELCENGEARAAGERGGPGVNLRGPRLVVGGDLFAAPPVVGLLELARRRLDQGSGVEAAMLTPRYLRDADARINWTTRPQPGPAYDA
jgi:tRNA threonylcarbamoyladenosine biosynthesis protein TsaB